MKLEKSEINKTGNFINDLNKKINFLKKNYVKIMKKPEYFIYLFGKTLQKNRISEISKIKEYLSNEDKYIETVVEIFSKNFLKKDINLDLLIEDLFVAKVIESGELDHLIINFFSGENIDENILNNLIEKEIQEKIKQRQDEIKEMKKEFINKLLKNALIINKILKSKFLPKTNNSVYNILILRYNKELAKIKYFFLKIRDEYKKL